MCPGMMPILALPGEMSPGQLGPISRLDVRARNALTLTMSITGTPSVMQAMSGTPASAASMMASAAAGGGTKIRAQSAPVAATASSTVFHTGNPSWLVPPLPGVTPPTTWVPYSLHRSAWKVPSRPVIPCTTTRVPRSTRMLIALLPIGGGLDGPLRSLPQRTRLRRKSRLANLRHITLSEEHLLPRAPRQLDGLRGALAHVIGRREVEAGLGQHGPPLLHVGALHPHHDREVEAELLDGRDQARRQAV